MNTTGSSNRTRQQLGLNLGRTLPQGRSPHRALRPCSRERALWWFQQMRHAIGNPVPSPNGVATATTTNGHAAG